MIDDILALFGEPIHVYTREQAIEDGVLIPAGTVRLIDGTPVSICFTANLHSDYEDVESRAALTRRGLAMLNDDAPEDTGCGRLRIIEEGRIWIVWDGDGITFMRPEDR